jgi:hypothetical protein
MLTLKDMRQRAVVIVVLGQNQLSQSIRKQDEVTVRIKDESGGIADADYRRSVFRDGPPRRPRVGRRLDHREDLVRGLLAEAIHQVTSFRKPAMVEEDRLFRKGHGLPPR